MIASHLRWALLLTTAALVLSDGEGDFQDLRVCDMPCCTSYNKNCNLTSILCNCSDKKLRLSGNWASESAQNIKLLADEVTIAKEAMWIYSSLQSLHLERLRRLYVEEKGLTLAKSSMVRLLTIQDVGQVIVKGSAFSGFWRETSEIKIKSIQVLNISEEAFDFRTMGRNPMQKPILKFIHIRKLNLAQRAVVSPMKRLSVVHVNMPTCPYGNFGSHINHTYLRNVTIEEVQKGCIESSPVLTIFSSRLQNIGSRGISGTFRKVKIRETLIEKVQDRGIDIHVEVINVANTHVKKQKITPLTVWVSRTLKFQNVTIELQDVQLCETNETTKKHITRSNVQSDTNFEVCLDLDTSGFQMHLHRPNKSVRCSSNRYLTYRQCTNASLDLYKEEVHNIHLWRDGQGPDVSENKHVIVEHSDEHDSAHNFIKNAKGLGIRNMIQTATDDASKSPTITEDRFETAKTTEDRPSIQTTTDDKLTIATTTEDELSIKTTTDDKLTTATTTENELTTTNDKLITATTTEGRLTIQTTTDDKLTTTMTTEDRPTTDDKFTTQTSTDYTFNSKITGNRKLKDEKHLTTVTVMTPSGQSVDIFDTSRTQKTPYDKPETWPGDVDTRHTTPSTLELDQDAQHPAPTPGRKPDPHSMALYVGIGVMVLLALVVIVMSAALLLQWRRRRSAAASPALPRARPDAEGAAPQGRAEQLDALIVVLAERLLGQYGADRADAAGGAEPPPPPAPHLYSRVMKTRRPPADGGSPPRYDSVVLDPPHQEELYATIQDASSAQHGAPAAAEGADQEESMYQPAANLYEEVEGGACGRLPPPAAVGVSGQQGGAEALPLLERTSPQAPPVPPMTRDRLQSVHVTEL